MDIMNNYFLKLTLTVTLITTSLLVICYYDPVAN